jgi:transcriptional regulator with XRE-family HTH domain
MKKFQSKHKDLMDLLDQVPGVKDHMESFEVKMGQQILKRRIELNLTQQKVVEIIQRQGGKITQATISKVERGDNTISTDTYNKIIEVLGGVKDLKIEFGECPKSVKRELEYA